MSNNCCKAVRGLPVRIQRAGLKRTSLFLHFLLGAFFPLSVFGQAEWEPVYLNAAGHSEEDGVRMEYRVVDCDGKRQVLIRTRNSNSNEVKVSWTSMAVLEGGKDRRVAKERSRIRLTPGGSIVGACDAKDGSSGDQVKVSLQRLLNEGDEFMRFGVRGFEVQATKEE